MSTSSVTSESAASSTVSSSVEQLVQPPVGKVEEKKKQVDDARVNNQLVNEWMSGIGNLYGAVEIRENVNNLHGHLLPAIETLEKILKHSSEELAGEVKKLLIYYSSLAKICEKMVEKMEKSDSVLEFQKATQPASHGRPPIVDSVNEKKQ